MKTRYSNDKGEVYYHERVSSTGCGGGYESITNKYGYPISTSGSGGDRPWHHGEWKAQVVQ